MNLETIKISLIRGDITCKPHRQIVRRGDKIEWVCEDENIVKFAINLGWNSPLRKGRYQSNKSKAVKQDVPKNAPYGGYKYFIAVLDKAGKLWTDDPELVIKR